MSNSIELHRVIENACDDKTNIYEQWSVLSVTHSNVDGTCACGHKHIKYHYTIENVHNGNIVYPIGSKCIEKFFPKNLYLQTKKLRKEMYDKQLFKQMLNESKEVIIHFGKYKNKSYGEVLSTYQGKSYFKWLSSTNFWSNKRSKIPKTHKKKIMAHTALQQYVSDMTTGTAQP